MGIYLDPCVTEDALNCYWDGVALGNGVGSSYVNYEGSWQGIDVPEGQSITLVYAHDNGTFSWELSGSQGDWQDWTTQEDSYVVTPPPVTEEASAPDVVQEQTVVHQPLDELAYTGSSVTDPGTALALGIGLTLVMCGAVAIMSERAKSRKARR